MKTSQLRVTGYCEGITGLCEGITSGLSSQRASNAENSSIWWRYNDISGDITIAHTII